jgi:hypothetical protein
LLESLESKLDRNGKEHNHMTNVRPVVPFCRSGPRINACSQDCLPICDNDPVMERFSDFVRIVLAVRFYERGKKERKYDKLSITAQTLILYFHSDVIAFDHDLITWNALLRCRPQNSTGFGIETGSRGRFWLARSLRWVG